MRIWWARGGDFTMEALLHSYYQTEKEEDMLNNPMWIWSPTRERRTKV